MSKRSDLLESIAETISDYREGDDRVATPTPEHVETWVNQFDKKVQKPILAELNHVFKRTYISKESVVAFLSGLVKNEDLVGDDPCSFWEDVEFLRKQEGGNSQREMLEIFDGILQDECGLQTGDCGEDPEVHMYIDDAIFTGNRVLNDIRSWLQSSAPAKAILHIIVVGYHRLGQWYANKNIDKVAAKCGKEIKIHWWRIFEVENHMNNRRNSDVLWPARLPDDPLVQTYASSLSHPFKPRPPGSVGEKGFFSSEEGRDLLEQELLKAGARIRSMCPHLNIYQRPLGNMVLESLGFGALLVTFRNCPNNCPLAFWAGDPWYPLFPRKTN